jgi:hypothetical protein
MSCCYYLFRIIARTTSRRMQWGWSLDQLPIPFFASIHYKECTDDSCYYISLSSRKSHFYASIAITFAEFSCRCSTKKKKKFCSCRSRLVSGFSSCSTLLLSTQKPSRYSVGSKFSRHEHSDKIQDWVRATLEWLKFKMRLYQLVQTTSIQAGWHCHFLAEFFR